jgi:hypothetical protein
MGRTSEAKSINKFAAEELKMLIRTHGTALVAWAASNPGGQVHPYMKNALLDIAARLYECIELLPEGKAKTNKKPGADG